MELVGVKSVLDQLHVKDLTFGTNCEGADQWHAVFEDCFWLLRLIIIITVEPIHAHSVLKFNISISFTELHFKVLERDFDN
jgi:hypothetical protein